MTTQEFTIYDTITYTIIIDDNEMLMEAWIVDDTFFDAPCWKMPDGCPNIAMAKLLTPFVLQELGLEDAKKNKDAKAIAVIRKSVADMASDFDIENLLKHESAHAYLGHEATTDGKLDWATQEKQVRELIGEAEVANDLFGVRWFALHNTEKQKGRDHEEYNYGNQKERV